MTHRCLLFCPSAAKHVSKINKLIKTKCQSEKTEQTHSEAVIDQMMMIDEEAADSLRRGWLR